MKNKDNFGISFYIEHEKKAKCAQLLREFGKQNGGIIASGFTTLGISRWAVVKVQIGDDSIIKSLRKAVRDSVGAVEKIPTTIKDYIFYGDNRESEASIVEPLLKRSVDRYGYFCGHDDGERFVLYFYDSADQIDFLSLYNEAIAVRNMDLFIGQRRGLVASN